MSTEVFLNEFAEISEHPYRILSQYKKEGKKVIGVLPYYAPAELVVAAGMVPMGIWGSNKKTIAHAKEYCATFYCTIAQLALEMLLDGTLDQLDGLITPTICDTLRPMSQNFRVAMEGKLPCIFLAHPQQRKPAFGLQFTMDQYQHIKTELEKIAGKEIARLRVVVNGAGAAAIACARLFIAVGVRRENMVFCDSRGVVTTYRTDINEIKREFATTRRITTLAEALHGADLFLGVSTADVLTPEMLRTMSTDPIVMALANPDPEIAYDKAVVSRPDIIFATGRSDYPNQVNNVLGFPYIFRGALDVRATKINEAMKLAAAHALAGLAQEPVPTMVLRAYALEKLEFGRDYLIPKPFDPRLLCTVAPAVARAAIESGVARQPIADWDAYTEKLRNQYQSE